MGIPSELLETIWMFVRGDSDPKRFERWLYAEPTLEAVLGRSLYMDSIETNFGDRESVFQLKERLRDFAIIHDESNCLCVRYSDLTIIDMGYHQDFLASLETGNRRLEGLLGGEAYWWLSTEACRSCGESWLMAAEERINDVYILRRLDPDERAAIRDENRWPSDFDRYETLLTIGKDAGRSVTFDDPLHSSLVYTVRDLIKARPGIRVSELASLLNVSTNLAASLAQRARRRWWKFW